jgi:hypothetical protein
MLARRAVVFKSNFCNKFPLPILGRVSRCHRNKNMPTQVFTLPGHEFSVFRGEDGAVGWSGGYRGTKVNAALPIDEARCLILLDTGASKREVFENLLCVDRSGKEVWKAQPPDQPDSFVKFEMTAGGLYAWTWSAWMVRLDPTTGKIIERQFVK